MLLLLGKLDKNDELMCTLLKALKSTLRFEQEMVKRFELDKYYLKLQALPLEVAYTRRT